jgi:hypothetical protein
MTSAAMTPSNSLTYSTAMAVMWHTGSRGDGGERARHDRTPAVSEMVFILPQRQSEGRLLPLASDTAPVAWRRVDASRW